MLTTIFPLTQPPYHEVLMKMAKANINDEQARVAVVVACMACEIFTEQVISFAFKKRGLEYLKKPVMKLSGHNLADDRTRKLYSALTKDVAIGDAPFWNDFKTVVTLRNQLVHSHARVSKDQAKNACNIVELVLAHLTKVLEELYARPDPIPQTW